MLGQASINTSSFKNWTPTVKAAPVEKVRKVKAPPKEVHPQFTIYASYYEHDPEWNDILLKCSYNKFPIGFRYQDYTLNYRKGTKSHSYVTQDITKQTADAVVGFMRNFGSMYSVADQKRVVAREPAEEVILCWESCKTNLRLSLMQEFCQYCMLTIPLTMAQRDDLYSALVIGLNTGSIQNSDVLMEKNKIVMIRSVQFVNGNFFCGEIRPPK